MRSIARVLGISVNTVSKLLVDAGMACQAYHDYIVWDLDLEQVERDEVWSFCYAGERVVSAPRV